MSGLITQASIDRAHAYALKNKKYFESLTPKDKRPCEGGLTKTEKRRLK